ncbi:Apoptosis-inducing factor 3 [Symbiodinium microadriaticum]|uniref:Apoptosis-inducing factor 3 n=1 Tax=Symbiodinium microadriaticum TaxID=2951 RepID=A0A1Q9F4Z4_SYMMI|nr:Apoptosis-inducing factor 3 [Symbiodinium microadriaticum]
MGAWGRSRLWMRCLSRCQAATFAAPAIARPVERWDLRPFAAMLTVALTAEQARRTQLQSQGCVGCASTQRVSLGQATEFEDASMREVKIEGGAVVLVHRHQGEFFVTSPACGHYGAPLRKGISSAGGRGGPPTVTCPLHDATFDLRTGQVVRGPSVDGIAVYKSEVKNGVLFADLPPELVAGTGKHPKEVHTRLCDGDVVFALRGIPARAVGPCGFFFQYLLCIPPPLTSLYQYTHCAFPRANTLRDLPPSRESGFYQLAERCHCVALRFGRLHLGLHETAADRMANTGWTEKFFVSEISVVRLAYSKAKAMTTSAVSSWLTILDRAMQLAQADFLASILAAVRIGGIVALQKSNGCGLRAIVVEAVAPQFESNRHFTMFALWARPELRPHQAPHRPGRTAEQADPLMLVSYCFAQQPAFEEAQARNGDAILVYFDNSYTVATLDRVCEITRRTGMHCGPRHAARNQMESRRCKAIQKL